MVKFFCAIVEEAGSAFPVDIEPCETVGDLKKKIKDAKMYQFPADELQLFLAKVPKEKHVEVERREEAKEEVQEDMTWLSSRSEGVKKLKKGEKTPLLEALTEETQELETDQSLESGSSISSPDSRVGDGSSAGRPSHASSGSASTPYSRTGPNDSH